MSNEQAYRTRGHGSGYRRGLIRENINREMSFARGPETNVYLKPIPKYRIPFMQYRTPLVADLRARQTLGEYWV